MSDSLMSTIATRLKIERQNKKLSQMELAEKANIHFTYYSQIERAIRKDISVRILKQITDALEIPISEVLNDAPDENNLN